MRKKDGKFVNIYFDKELLDKLDKYALDKGQTRTTCLELIVREKLEKKNKTEVRK